MKARELINQNFVLTTSRMQKSLESQIIFKLLTNFHCTEDILDNLYALAGGNGL